MGISWKEEVALVTEAAGRSVQEQASPGGYVTSLEAESVQD